MAYKNKEQDKAWRESHKSELKEYHRLWRLEHPESIADYGRSSRAEIKIEVLSFYGKDKKPKCCWPGCEIDDVDMLVLDHIENDGAEKRKSGKDLTGFNGYRKLRQAGYPDGYQTLCCNHNQKKELMRRR